MRVEAARRRRQKSPPDIGDSPSYPFDDDHGRCTDLEYADTPTADTPERSVGEIEQLFASVQRTGPIGPPTRIF